MNDYALGLTSESILSLSAMGLEAAPSKASPVDYLEYVPTGDGTPRGIGGLQCVWRFSYLTKDQMTTVRSILTNNTYATVYVRTKSKSGEFKIYTAVMSFIEQVVEKADLLTDVVFSFKYMVEVT